MSEVSRYVSWDEVSRYTDISVKPHILIKYSLNHVLNEMCTFNSFYLQNFLLNFLHPPYTASWSRINMVCKIKSGIGKTTGWSISPELMFVLLISFTSIVYFNLKVCYYLMWLEIIPFFSAPDTWLKLAAWKSFNWNPLFESFFNQANYHHIFTQSILHVVVAYPSSLL